MRADELIRGNAYTYTRANGQEVVVKYNGLRKSVTDGSTFHIFQGRNPGNGNAMAFAVDQKNLERIKIYTHGKSR